MHQQSTSVLLINGSVGVGKSTVADAVFEILKERSVPIALVNLDELGYAFPRPEDDPSNIKLRLKNLAAIWKNYHEAGAKNLIIPCVTEDRKSLNDFREAVPDAHFFVVHLDAPLAVIVQRIRNRPMGGSMEWHLKRAAELTAILEKNKVDDLVISTNNRTIPEIAHEVIDNWANLPYHDTDSKK